MKGECRVWVKENATNIADVQSLHLTMTIQAVCWMNHELLNHNSMVLDEFGKII